MLQRRQAHVLRTASLASLVLLGAAACNNLTGAADLHLADGSGGSKSGSSGSGRTTSAGSGGRTGSSGAGDTSGGDTSGTSGATTGPTGATSGATTGAGTSGGATTVASSSSSVASSSSSSSGSVCNYPAGPYGVSQGDVINQSDSWQGFLEMMSSQSTVGISEYFDCDGSRGINAVLIDVSAVWCGACQQEAQDLPQAVQSWQGKGIRVVTLLIEDGSGSPASVSDAKNWKSTYGLDGISTLADPNSALLPMSGSIGLPYQILVDPRTMKIVSTEEGYSGDDSALLALAAKNHP